MTTGDSIKAAADLLVPAELVAQLKEADQRLHAARQSVEQAMDEQEPDHQKGIDKAQAELQAAERDVEQISARIHEHRARTSGQGTAKDF